MNGIISSRNYFPGDLIYSEEPFCKVVLQKNREIMCEGCGEMALGFLKYCKECKAVKYCGKACQKKDWPSHRLECKRLKNLPDTDTADFVRFLGKIILKTKDCDWKLIKKRILGKDFSFDDIDTHFAYFKENPKMKLLFKEMKDLLEKYIGVENMPDNETLLKIVGKVKSHSFRNASFFFCLGLPHFDEECIPNSCLCITGHEVKVWACKRIRKGIDKISVPKRHILSKMEEAGAPCKCTDCSLPYGESVLTKIIDEKRAFSVIQETESVLLAFSVMPSFSWNYEVIDELLLKQKDVLGHTNDLHLKLLALRCFHVDGHPLETRAMLLELERDMKSVFGEHYSEMEKIYEALGFINLQLLNPVAAVHYMQKAKRIGEYRMFS